MKILGIYSGTIQQFEEENLVSVSEPPIGAFFWADDETLKNIKNFEEKNNALVYLVIRTYFQELGTMDSYLFVSDYKEERESDKNNLKNNQSLTYVYNHDFPVYSEFGAIGFEKKIAAGLRRTW